MRCVESFSCQDPLKTIHFKFERFEIENNYDFLLLGYTEEFEHFHDNYFDVNGHYIDKPDDKIGLLLDHTQQTDIWVSAQSIPNFNIVFGRTVFCFLD